MGSAAYWKMPTEGQRGHRLFAAREQHHALQPLAGGEATTSIPLSALFSSRSAAFSVAAAEQFAEGGLEVLVDLVKASSNFWREKRRSP